MSQLPTIHIEAKTKDEIAKTVLMPGDPLRAKFIADQFLKNVTCFNQTRGMLGFTGTYKGKKISVMGSGMGIPSMAIYSYELYAFYDVKTIIRIGSCGAYAEDLKLYDLLIASDVYSESIYAHTQSGEHKPIIKPSNHLNKQLIDTAKCLNFEYRTARIHTSDVFYEENPQRYKKIRDKFNCSAVDMETFALFYNAKRLNKQAASLLTVTDLLKIKEAISQIEREQSLTTMIELALQTATQIED